MIDEQKSFKNKLFLVIHHILFFDKDYN